MTAKQALYQYGDRVRFTSGGLGIVDPAQPRVAFMDATVGPDDHGTVLANSLPDGWLAVEPDGYPGKYVPVHPSMIERAA